MSLARRRISGMAVPLVLTLLSSVVLAAGMPPPQHDFTEPGGVDPGTGDYAIVIFKDPPAASYSGGIPGLKATKPARGQKLDPDAPDVKKYVTHLRGVHDDFKKFLASRAPRAQVVREYFLSANAVAIRLNGHRPGDLAGAPGVRAVTGSWLYRPAMNVSTDLINADEIWRLLGASKGARGQNGGAAGRERAGAGIKVGIIDSGIDKSHPFFRCKDKDDDGDVDDSDIPTKVYASGVAGDPGNVLVNDHGTHVAGTVAGCVTELPSDQPVQGTISGVAPAAELYDYNVFPGFGAGWVAFGGLAFSHDIAAALEDGVRDGMDVVNMSLGGTVQGPHDFLAEAVDAAVDAGTVVVVAAGNSGPGDATVESPGSAAKAITVGASSNPHYIGMPVHAGGRGFAAAVGDFRPFGRVTAGYAVARDGSGSSYGCSALVNAAEVRGKIALIDRGGCSFSTKVRNAEAAGATGVLVANNVAGDPIAMGHDGSNPFPEIPAAMVSKSDGEFLKELLARDPSATVTVDGTTVQEIVSANADILAGFSSRGPAPFTYLVKPDVTAPGVNVYSSVFAGRYAMFQGTSMAAPHVTGAVALLLQLHPDWAPADVKSALANTAAWVITDPVTAARDPGVLARGGGRIDLSRASAVPVTVDPVSASFGYWNGNADVKASLELALHNVSGRTQTCTVTVERDAGDPAVAASAGSMTLAAGESGRLILTLDAGRADRTPSGDYDGDVVLDCGETSLRVPWWVRIDREAKP